MAAMMVPNFDMGGGGGGGDVTPAPTRDPAAAPERSLQEPIQKQVEALGGRLAEAAQKSLGSLADAQRDAAGAGARAGAQLRDGALALQREPFAPTGRPGDGQGGMFDFRGMGQHRMDAPAGEAAWQAGDAPHPQARPMPDGAPVRQATGYGTARTGNAPARQTQSTSDHFSAQRSTASEIQRAAGALDGLTRGAPGHVAAPLAAATVGPGTLLRDAGAVLPERGLPGGQAGAHPDAFLSGQGSAMQGVAVQTGTVGPSAAPATIRDGQAGSPSGATQPRGADAGARQSAATAGNAASRTVPDAVSATSGSRSDSAPAASSAGTSTAAAGGEAASPAAGQGSVVLPATRSDGNSVAQPPQTTLAAPGLAGGGASRHSPVAAGEEGAAARLPQRLVGGFTQWLKEALGFETPPEHARYILMQLPVEVRELLQIDAAAALVDSPELLTALLDLVGNRHPTDDGGDALLRLFDHFVARRPSRERVHHFFNSLTVDQVQYLVTHRFEVVSHLPGVPEWAFKSFHEIAEALGE